MGVVRTRAALLKKKGVCTMAFSLHGVHVPHRKNTHSKPVLRMDIPQTVTIPMNMHIGAPATPIVQVGEEVKVGQKIAEAAGFVSVPVYSSVSGKVTKIADRIGSNGKTTAAIVIAADGEQTVADTVAAPSVTNRDELLTALKESGVVGLGGAGFPTYVKFAADPERMEYLIVNGAECEPYVTSDTRTMLDRVEDMKTALLALNTHLGIQNIVIGIENNKKDAIKSMMGLMKDLAATGKCRVTVKSLPAVYPQGGEKVLIYNLTRRAVPEGKLPIDIGMLVLNVTTVAEIAAYIRTGMPLVSKCVTVDGSAVAEPKNVIAPIGASLSDVFAFAGGFKCEPKKILWGGPMMGKTL